MARGGDNVAMRSPTQPVLDAATAIGLVHEALGADTVVTDAVELSGGGFAAVWRATLGDGRSVVLKVGPPPDARLLRYEQGLIAAEADYFRLVGKHSPAVPVPQVLHHGDGWLLTTCLPGRNLVDWAESAAAGPAFDDSPAREQLGAAVAAVHTITGSRFGYLGARPAAASWPQAFAAMVDDLLRDAVTWQVTLPVEPARIRAVVAAHHDALALVTRPALVHFDLWDGNVLATLGGDGRAHLSGLVDGERHFYGDPLVDLVSSALFRRMEDEPDHPFLRGYARAQGGPVRLDGPARTRLTLYRLHLYLLMLVEVPSRGMAGDTARHTAVTELFCSDLAALQP